MQRWCMLGWCKRLNASTTSVCPELVEGPSLFSQFGMTFWAYMLHCRGGSFYVGQTDNLDQRMAQHSTGHFPGFTSERLPVELVWSQEFTTRFEAIEAERRIKGWSRKKKLALIRGDWDAISRYARGKEEKDDPSTSSGQTEESENL